LCFLVETEQEWAKLLAPPCTSFSVPVSGKHAAPGDVYLLACKAACGWGLVGFGALLRYEEEDGETIAVVHDIIPAALNSTVLADALVVNGTLRGDCKLTLDQLFISNRHSGCKVTERLVPWASSLYDQQQQQQQQQQHITRVSSAAAAGAVAQTDAVQPRSAVEDGWTKRRTAGSFCRADPSTAVRHSDIDLTDSPPRPSNKAAAPSSSKKCGQLTTAVRSTPYPAIQKAKKQGKGKSEGKKAATGGASFGQALPCPAWLFLGLVGLGPSRKPRFGPSRPYVQRLQVGNPTAQSSRRGNRRAGIASFRYAQPTRAVVL
jgi:hypothetical protein